MQGDSTPGGVVYWRKLKDLPDRAGKGMAVRDYSDGDFIYRGGDAADAVFRLRTGQVRLVRAEPERLLSGDDDRDAYATATACLSPTAAGNTLNGLRLGGKDHPVTAPLGTGESELVAGGADSPFRCSIVME